MLQGNGSLFPGHLAIHINFNNSRAFPFIALSPSLVNRAIECHEIKRRMLDMPSQEKEV